MDKSAIIIGAGVIGIASAYALVQRGWKVTLLDQDSGPAMGASHANGAQLSYCYTDALGSPATFSALPQLLLGNGGVSFGLKPSLAYIGWLLRFAVNCTPSAFKRNTLEVLELAHQSRHAMDRLIGKHAFDFSHRIAGKVHLLYSQQEIARAKQSMAFKRSAGCEQQLVTREGFSALDAALEGVDPAAIAALSTPSEVVADPLMFCRQLLGILTGEHQCDVRFGAKVSNVAEAGPQAIVSLDNGEELIASKVVIASGKDANQLLAPLGYGQPIQPMKGYSFEMPLSRTSPVRSVTDGKRRLVFTNLGDRMRVAGIAQLGNGSSRVNPARIDWLIAAARECLADGGDYNSACNFWAGHRPVTPNSQPVIKRASQCIAINTGHGALGWTLAMGSGERLADILEQ